MIITVQTLFALPFSALNRDDAGSPKHYHHGGVMRGQLSSQSLKRAARVNFEARVLKVDRAIRSGEMAQEVLSRVKMINPERVTDEAAEEKLLASIDETLAKLNRKPKTKNNEVAAEEPKEKPKEGSKPKTPQAISIFLSDEEIELIAAGFAAGKVTEPHAFFDGRRTGSLAIAAFGRMFANAAYLSTEAAIAVSDASCVHESMLEVDYFTTTSDHVAGGVNSQGATFLSEQSYTSGIFHRSFTIDTDQLHTSWTGMDRADAAEKIEMLVDELIGSLPGGKKNSTAPYTPPLLVIAEVQRRRQSYHFETPVVAPLEGGYSAAAVAALAAQVEQLRAFDPDLIEAALVAGTADVSAVPGVQVNLPQLRRQVTDWIMA